MGSDWASAEAVVRMGYFQLTRDIVCDSLCVASQFFGLLVVRRHIIAFRDGVANEGIHQLER